MVRLEKGLEYKAPLIEDPSIQSALAERMMVLYSDGMVPRAGDQIEIDGKYKGKILANLDTLSFLPGQEVFDDMHGGTGLLVNTDFGGEIYYPAEAADEFVLISREQDRDN